jgi:hypothetical protein
MSYQFNQKNSRDLLSTGLLQSESIDSIEQQLVSQTIKALLKQARLISISFIFGIRINQGKAIGKVCNRLALWL